MPSDPGAVRVTSGATGELTPDPRNARTHDERNRAMIERSLREVGAGRSIVLARDGTILAGNATVAAAEALGMTGIIVVETDGTELVAVKRRDVAPESPDAAKLALYDNRSAELAGWDGPRLQELEAALGDLDFVLSETEFEQLIRRHTVDGTVVAGLTDEDEAPPVAEEGEPVTVVGEAVRLGDHRLLCGDALDLARVVPVFATMDQAGPDLIVTDPPYGLDMSRSLAGRPARSGTGHKNYPKWEPIEGDARTPAQMLAFLTDMVATFRAVGERIPWYVCTNWRMYPLLWEALAGEVNSCIVWVKNLWGLGAYFRHQHEFVAYRGPTLADRDVSDVWQIGKGDPRQYHHVTQKPVELVRLAIETSSVTGDLVYDPFCGSGTGLIACEETGRRCLAVELSPAICDVAIARWEAFTGRAAERGVA